MTAPYDGDPARPRPTARPPIGRSPASAGARRSADAALPPNLDPRRGGARRPPAPGARRPAPGAPRRPTGPGGPGGPNGPGGPAGPPPGGPRRRRRLKWALGGGGGLLVAIVIGVVVMLLLAFTGIAHVPWNFKSVPDAATGDLNILVVGSDSRAGLTPQQQNALHVGHDAGQRTDTMLIVHIPAGSGKATIVSLPRDSYVTIPAHRYDGQTIPAAKGKLNAAFAEGGASLLTQTVEDTTGVHLDHYVQINFLGFVNVVNALGGVTVCTATPINDPVRRDPSGTGYIGSGLRLPAGKSKVNGITALEYVRAREFDPTQDLGRMRRQQEFIADMIRAAKSAGVLLNPFKLHGVVNAAAQSLKTDPGFGAGTMFSLLWRLHSVSPSSVQEMTVPLQNPQNPAIDKPIGGINQSVVVWDPHLSKVLFSDLEHDKPVDNLISKHKVPIAPSQVSLKVLNATTTNGFAARAAADLAARGFNIAGTGNAPKGSDPAKTVVLYGSGRAQSAETLAASVPGSVKQLSSSIGAQGLELVVGSNYKGTIAVKVATNAPTINNAGGRQCQTA